MCKDDSCCCPLNQAKVPDFPQYTLRQLEEEVTFGVYQLKQAESYSLEHLNKKVLIFVSFFLAFFFNKLSFCVCVRVKPLENKKLNENKKGNVYL